MVDETNRIFGKILQCKFEFVQIHCDPEHVFRASLLKRLRDKADSGSNDTANESTVVLVAAAEAYECAVQALRDVRHLLPANGVTIVDAALDCATRLEERRE